MITYLKEEKIILCSQSITLRMRWWLTSSNDFEIVTMGDITLKTYEQKYKVKNYLDDDNHLILKFKK